jgi:hypothetical protein
MFYTSVDSGIIKPGTWHPPPIADIFLSFGRFTSEFLATDPEVPSSIPGATRFSEK